MTEQMFVAQPMEDLCGLYEVVKRILVATDKYSVGDYQPIESKLTYEDAIRRASILNKEYKEEAK